MTQWYYSDSERNRHGPLDGEAMIDRHRSGELGPDTLVWRDGLSQWRPWRELAGELLADPGVAANSPSVAAVPPAERAASTIATAVEAAHERAEVAAAPAAQTRVTAAAEESTDAWAPTGAAPAARPVYDAAASGPTAPDATGPYADSAHTAPGHADPSRPAGPVSPGPISPAAAEVARADRTTDAPPYTAAESHSPYAAPRAGVADDTTVVQGLEVIPGGFWKRFAAYMIDSLLISFAYYAISFVGVIVIALGGFASNSGGGLTTETVTLLMTGVIYLLLGVISAAYYAGMESSSTQATLGKMAVGIKVVDNHGRRLSRGRALARWAASLVSYLTLCVGYLLIAFTDRKLGLHDMIAKTQVVDRWAYTARPELQRRDLGPVTWVVLVLVGLVWLLVIGAIAVMVALGLGK